MKSFARRWESFRTCGAALGVLAILGASAAATAAPGDALGPEFRVPDIAQGGQSGPDVSRNAAGDFVVIWQDFVDAGAGFEPFARSFLPDGSPRGPQFRVNEGLGKLSQPRIAMATDASFVATWLDYVSYDDLSPPALVVGRRFAADGAPLSGDFQIASIPRVRTSIAHELATSPAGAFVSLREITEFTGTDVAQARSTRCAAQRFRPDGTARGAAVPVCGGLGGDFGAGIPTINGIAGAFKRSALSDADVSVDGRGGFVVIWLEHRSAVAGADPGAILGSDVYVVRAQRYSPLGVALGPPYTVARSAKTFLLDDTAVAALSDPAVAVEPDGDFTVVWKQADGLYLRRYVDGGVRPLPAGRIHEGFVLDRPDLAVAANGQSVVVWKELVPTGTGPQPAILAQLCDATGAALVTAIQVNETFALAPRGVDKPSVASDGSGNFVAVWEFRGAQTDRTILARRFSGQGGP